MHLPISVRLKLVRQGLLAAAGIGGNRAVALRKDGDAIIVEVDGREIYVPSPLRWKLYRQGWKARLDRLEQEYGVGRFVQLGAESVIVDIGANAGEFAHIAARYGARIYCCEPDPIVGACLELNISEIVGASTHRIAIWRENADLAFGLASDRADSSFFVDSDRRITVRAQTLDSFLAANAIGKVDLVKCDAEGAEPEVLDGLIERAQDVAAIALDTGAERYGERTHDACAERLAARGFDVIEEKIGTRWMTYGVRR
ncbi:MAG: FkbM family methyltransferase [Alphaproteobacteria bacterium]|nr:FkbM family methyltransferase [Alphaproteobacteria bacterium]